MKDDGSEKKKRPRRKQGPPILMTNTEYAAVARVAAHQECSLSSYVRKLALSHRLEADYSSEEIHRVRRAGRRFNHFVHELHIDSTIHFGAKRPGRRHYDDVMRELYVLEQALRKTPRKTWRLAINQISGGKGTRVLWGIARCTPQEHIKIKARAKRAGMSQAAFIRAVTLHRPIGKASFYKMIDQLERIENNLHQLLNLRTWDYVGGQRIHLIIRDIDHRIRELSSGRKRKEDR